MWYFVRVHRVGTTSKNKVDLRLKKGGATYVQSAATHKLTNYTVASACAIVMLSNSRECAHAVGREPTLFKFINYEHTT